MYGICHVNLCVPFFILLSVGGCCNFAFQVWNERLNHMNSFGLTEGHIRLGCFFLIIQTLFPAVSIPIVLPLLSINWLTLTRCVQLPLSRSYWVLQPATDMGKESVPELHIPSAYSITQSTSVTWPCPTAK